MSKFWFQLLKTILLSCGMSELGNKSGLLLNINHIFVQLLGDLEISQSFVFPQMVSTSLLEAQLELFLFLTLNQEQFKLKRYTLMNTFPLLLGALGCHNLNTKRLQQSTRQEASLYGKTD